MKFKFYSFLFIILNFSGNIMAQNIKFTNDELKKHLLSSSPENEVAKDINGNPMVIDANGDGEISIQEALNVYQLKVGMGNIYPKKPSWDNSKTNFSSELTYFTNVRIFKYEGLIDYYNCSVCMDYFVDATGFTNLEELYFLDGHFFYKRYHLNIKLPEYLPNLKIVDAPTKISFSQAPNLEKLNCSYTFRGNLNEDGLIFNYEKLDFSDFKKLRSITANAENLNLSNLPSLEELTVHARDSLVLKNLPSLEKIKTLPNDSYLSSYHYYLSNHYYYLENLPKIDSFFKPINTYVPREIHMIIKRLSSLKFLKFGNSNDYYSSFHITKLELEDLPELTSIDFSHNSIKTLDLSKNIPKLSKLILYNNSIETLNISNNILLDTLDLTTNSLTHIDVKNHKRLKYLSILDSPISNLDISNNVLIKDLNIGRTQISEIDLSKQVNLTSFSSGGNDISTLDFSKNVKISNLKLSYPNDNGRKQVLKHLIIKNDVPDPWINNYRKHYLDPDLESICCDEIELEKVKQVFSWFPDTKFTTDCSTLGLSTNEIKIQTEVTLYPNPASDFLFINTKEKITKVEIFDTNGRLLISENIILPKVTVSTLPKGSYFMTLHYAKGKINKPFIKN
ncbi:T9SS type A sorting domain-containing protein [Apibacter raozihei]|uniref:T9SS type A sorting domain-containing protein n=1 Tax=Apibacter raozihei TaxID=2500547 RepID=UPI000FE2BED4|nr:T9SS type A sorting domain-containing protein [Apibacter raozihei]